MISCLEHTGEDNITIDWINDISLLNVYPGCISVKVGAGIRIKNSSSDTLLFSVAKEGDSKCYFYQNVKLYHSNTTRDSLFFYSVSMGDDFGKLTYDTLLPGNVIYYLEDKNHIKEIIELGNYAQFSYYYNKPNDNKTYSLKMILNYNEDEKLLKQIRSTIPSNVKAFSIEELQ